MEVNMYCIFLSSKKNCKAVKAKPLPKCELKVLLQKNGEVNKKEKLIQFLECYVLISKEKGEKDGEKFFKENISEIFNFPKNNVEPLSLFEAQTLLKTLENKDSGLRYQTRVPVRLENFLQKLINQ